MVDFIGLGFRRCATSWINQILSQHHQVSKPLKGLHFFNNNYERGLEWYEAEISKNKTNTTKVYGEFCTTYSYPEHYKKVLHRIKSTYPHCKIIVSIRNPSERFISDYKRSIRRAEVAKLEKVDEIINSNKQAIERGFYYRVINAINDLFPRDNIHTIHFDEIEKKPELVVKNLLNFLEIDINQKNLIVNKVNKTYMPHSASVEYFVNKMQNIGSKIGNVKIKFFFKSLKIDAVIRAFNDKRSYKNDELFIELKNELNEIYRNDYENVLKITNE